VLFQQNDFLRPNEDKKSAGRNASCKEELEQKNKEREASTLGLAVQQSVLAPMWCLLCSKMQPSSNVTMKTRFSFQIK
jgi:hypothetical protein